MSRLIVAVERGEVVVRDGRAGVVGEFSPDAAGCVKLGAMFAQYGITESVSCSSSVDFPEDGGLPGFAAHDFIADALAGAARLLAKPAEDSPERAVEIAHLAVVDTVLEHLSECPHAVREAVAEWRKAGEALVRSQRGAS